MKKVMILNLLVVLLIWITLLLADDTNPPQQPVRLIFIHHSCGGNWLADPSPDYPSGGLGAALKNNNYFVSATNYGWGPHSIGDRTDIPNWPEWFTGPNRNEILTALYNESGQNIGEFGAWSRLATNPGGENQIIMFKSCYPNSDLYGQPNDAAYDEPNDWEFSVANAKAVYNKILTYFATRQDKLFIVITAPPMLSSEYAPGIPSPSKRAANARAFNTWLVENWLSNYPYKNVAVFNYYNVLTSNGGSPYIHDANVDTGNHHRWWKGAIQHVQPFQFNFAAYPSGDSHPTSAGHQKATIEFVPLLNIFYNRWRASLAVKTHPTSPEEFKLHAAYPNPFNQETVLSFSAPDGAEAELVIYNLLGIAVRHFDFGRITTHGLQQVKWNGCDDQGRILPSGVYFYQIRMNQRQAMGKVLLNR